MGFDKPLKSGPINILFHLYQELLSEDRNLKVEWNFWNGKKWELLNAVDKTENLTRNGMLQLVVPQGFSKKALFGKNLYWLRGRIIRDTYSVNPKFMGIYPNTAWAFEATSIEDEIIGSSNGTPNQQFSILRYPIIEQKLLVREPNLPTDDEKTIIIKEEGDDAIQIKSENGTATEYSICWHEVDHFFESNAKSRHYLIDKINGTVSFGDGIRGMIPPTGIDNLEVSYQFGGGTKGNVKYQEINAIKTVIPGVEKVINHIEAGAGSDTETVEQVLERGPLNLKHRNRAVTEIDFEILARQASSQVARARCLSYINRKNEFEIGWVTIIIVPKSKDDKPLPSAELIKSVGRFFEKTCINLLSKADHVYVIAPTYVEVSVSAEIVPISIDLAAEAEAATIATLKSFLHPLSGGFKNSGCEFGKGICISEIHALLESIPKIDYVVAINLKADAKSVAEKVEIGENMLICSGEHDISMKLI